MKKENRRVLRVLCRNNMFEKKYYSNSFEGKIIIKLMSNVVVMDSDNWIYQISNVAVHDSDKLSF